MAVNKPVGDNARKGSVRKRTQRKTALMGKKTFTKRSTSTGRFVDQKKAPAKGNSRASEWRNRSPLMTFTKPEPPERSKIDVRSATLLKSWARALGVSRQQLKGLVGKVGNSAATVRKELDMSRKQAGKDTSAK
jgi:hypothetical protein